MTPQRTSLETPGSSGDFPKSSLEVRRGKPISLAGDTSRPMLQYDSYLCFLRVLRLFPLIEFHLSYFGIYPLNNALG